MIIFLAIVEVIFVARFIYSVIVDKTQRELREYTQEDLQIHE